MRTKKSLINVAIGIISLFFTTILGFINSRFFAMNIGVEISGLNNVFTNIISIMSVTELGIAGAINYNLYKPVHDKDYIKISQIMSFYKKCYILIGAIILCISLIISNYVFFFIENSTLTKTYIQLTFILCALSTVFSYFLAYHRNLFYVFQDNYITLVIDSIIRIITLALQLIVVILYKNYVLYLIINLVSNVLSNLIIAFISKAKYKEVKLNIKPLDKSLEKKVFNDVKSLAVIQVTSALINFTDSLIISKILGIIIAGIYSYYAQIIVILTNLINMIFNSLGASIGNLLAENNRENIKNVLHFLSYLCIFMGLILASGIINVFQSFVIFWLGTDFLIPISVIFILGINFYIMIQRQVITYYLRTGGYHKNLVIPLLIEASINLLISISLSLKYGLIGVFIGTLISAIYGFIQNSYLLFHIFEFDYKKYITREIFYFLLFILEVLFTRITLNFMNLNYNAFLNFFITGIISIIIPMIIIIINIFKNKKLKDIISSHVLHN